MKNKNFLKKLTAGILGFVMTLGVGAAGYASGARVTSAASGETHKITDCAFSQLLNNNATISPVTISDQGYYVSHISMNVKYNKTAGGVTISATIGGVSVGDSITYNKNATSDIGWDVDPVLKGNIVFTFVNNCGSGSQKGTFYFNSVTLTEGTASQPVVTGVTLTPSASTELEVGESETFTVGITGTDLTGDETVSIEGLSSLSSYLSCNKTSSELSALKNGNTFKLTATTGGGNGFIYAKYDDSKKSSSVTITTVTPQLKYPLDADPILGSYVTSMYIGGNNATQDLTFIYSPTNTDETILVTSSDSSILSVSQKTSPSGGSATYTLTAVNPGTATVTVAGALGVYSATTDVITVETKAISTFSVTGSMTKLSYEIGDNWDPSGLKVLADYNDGTTGVDITSSVEWTYSKTTTELGVGENLSVTCYANFDGKKHQKTQNGISITMPDFDDDYELAGTFQYISHLGGTNLDTTYYMNFSELNSKGAPKATTNKDSATIVSFQIVGNNQFYIYSGDDYLYGTADNNGLRIGDSSSSNRIWEVSDGYSTLPGTYDLKNVGTGRFLTLYNNEDFRIYTTHNAVNRKSNTDLKEYIPPVKPASLSLDINEYTFTAISGTKKVTPTVSGPSGKTITSPYEINWSSSSVSVATVQKDSNGKGVITPVGTGTTTITATIPANQTDSGVALSQTVAITVRTFAFNYSGATTLKIGDEVDLSKAYSVSPKFSDSATFAWSSSNDDNLSVSNGIVTAKATSTKETITLTVTDNGYTYSDSIDFEILSNIVQPTKVVLNKNNSSLTLGGFSDTVTVTILGENDEPATSQEFNFSGYDANKISVVKSNSILTISPLAAGDTSITVNFAGGDSTTAKTISVTVSYAAVTSLALAINKTSMFGNQSAEITATVNQYASLAGINFTVSPENVATVTLKTGSSNVYTLTPVNKYAGGEISVTANIGTVNSNTVKVNVVNYLNYIGYQETIVEDVPYTLTTGSVTSDTTIKDDHQNSYSVTSDGSYTSNTNYIQVGTNSAEVSYLKLSTSSFAEKNISKIQVWGTSKADSNVTPKIYIGGHLIGTGPKYTSQTASSGGTEYSVENADEYKGDILIEISRGTKTKGAIYFNKLIVTCEETSKGETVNLSNTNLTMQSKVVEFAQYFSGEYAKGENHLRSNWETISGQYTSKLSTLSADDLELAHYMFENATTTPSGTDTIDCLQNCVAQYESAVKTLKLNDFIGRFETFTVTFNSNGGSAVDPQTVLEGEKATQPENPLLEGNSFEGWTLDGNEFNFNTPITGNITLDANWDLIEYSLTLSGSNITISDNAFDYGEPVSVTLTPSRGYSLPSEITSVTCGGQKFVGYSYSVDSSTGIGTFTIGSMPAGNIVISASASVINYSINYNLDGGTNSPNNPASYNVNSETITLEEASKEGYTFNYWYDNDGQVATIDSGSIGDRELSADFTINEYNVKFEGTNINWDKSGDTVKQNYGTTFTTTLSVSGQYKLPGSVSVKCDGNDVPSSYDNELGTLSFTIPAGDVTITAVASSKSSISYSEVDGTAITGDYLVTSYQEGEGVTLVPAHNKTGYTFVGWYRDKALSQGPVTVVTTTDTGNLTFYAKWAYAGQDALDCVSTNLGVSYTYAKDGGNPVVSKAASNDPITYDFTAISDFDNWGSTYKEHVVEYDDATITFVSANHQSGTITDMPVTKGKSVIVVAKGGKTITNISGLFKQWTTKTHNISLQESSDGGATFTDVEGSYSDFKYPYTALSANTNAVKFNFSGSDQIGIQSFTIKYSDPLPPAPTYTSTFKFSVKNTGMSSLIDMYCGVYDDMGIAVSYNDRVRYFSFIKAEDDKYYIHETGKPDVAFSFNKDGSSFTLNLGDILNNIDNAKVEFTVQAYIHENNQYHLSENSTTYSLIGWIDEYYSDSRYTAAVKEIHDILHELLGE